MLPFCPDRELNPPPRGRSFEEIENEIVLTRLNDDLEYYSDLLKVQPHRAVAINRIINHIKNKIKQIEK
jgi:hypothetical protein